ncbi:cell-cell signaling protein [Thecamonas trahens ATCC 50062]|uniref:Cell-cell signaling protein n=1 Tax=Thecamonas trahens ATCC 50062 TaxID=461836 RepID=A0A0L0DTQ1_THETB|nr:cell-cell signaling protein [Thecamonas trahens ATCC 50062]KNC55709.1 cell-cell signaling protein [Thecamonas trahens ATCC 50062]|eukprot:XP_013752920.1 cell-cell signaling protein [Thecamonas trahens ATCC 50062]
MIMGIVMVIMVMAMVIMVMAMVIMVIIPIPGAAAVIDLDVTSDASLAALAPAVSAHTPQLDLVIYAAGLLHRRHAPPGEPAGPERRLADVSRDSLTAAMAVNGFGPILAAAALEKLVPRRDRHAVWATLTARVGSIGDNGLGGWYAYRASKAAANMLMRTLAIEWRRSRPAATVLAIHPGTVATPLSAPFRSPDHPGVLPAADAADNILARIADAEPSLSGSFLAYDGSPIEW